MSILQSFRQFKCANNFARLFKPIADAITQSMTSGMTTETESSKAPRIESAYQLLGVVKSILYSLSLKGEVPDYPDVAKAMSEGGNIIGELLKIMLRFNRVFCESFVSNLIAEFPSGSLSLDDEVVSENVIIVLGRIAISVQDDTVFSATILSLQTFIDCTYLSFQFYDAIQQDFGGQYQCTGSLFDPIRSDGRFLFWGSL